jgi:hypothetical protein
MSAEHAPLWLDAPEDHDYPAAAAYLRLLAEDAAVDAAVVRFRAAGTVIQRAKDLLRASRLPLLDRRNHHVEADLHKIAHGEPLSPILLVRGDLRADRPLVIADGYHRVCAVFHADEDADIPCRLIDWPEAPSAQY